MTTKQRTKLELVRIEGICKMLLKKIEAEQLTDLVESVTKASSKEIKKAIFRLPRYQLIEVIEHAGAAITDKDIDDAYEQYRYGLKPGFILFSITKKCKNPSAAAAFRAISESLLRIPYTEDENIKAITAKSHANINVSVIEYSFSYLNKHSYLTEKEEPAFVYEYEECFAWIDVKNGFLAIKSAPDKVLTILKRSFSIAYGAQFSNIKLTKKLIRDIFGEDNIKKGSFIKPNASDNEAEKLVVSDSRFSEKQAIQNSVSGYEMMGTYLNETVGEGQNNTLGINCEKGKLYLTSNVNATLFREWSVRRITSIIAYLSNGADFFDLDVFKAKNVMDSAIWNGLSHHQKDLIEQICYAVYVACGNKQDNSTITCDLLDVKKSLKSFMYDDIIAFCEVCNESFSPRCVCGSSLLKIDDGGRIFCTDCFQEVDELFCEEGHGQRNIQPSEALVLYPAGNFLGKISTTLKISFGIELIGSFYIRGDRLTLLPEQTGTLVMPNTIPELKSICDIDFGADEYDAILESVQAVKEKCRSSTNRNCNLCLLSGDKLCMMKLFSTNPMYRPSPHQHGEFGDISFSVTYNDGSCELVGIAKSAQKGKEVLNLSEPSAREMLQQVLSATHDARIGIIAAICPVRFHDQLVEELRYIAKITGKPIVIFDDMFMTRQYVSYKKIMAVKDAH